MKGFAALVRSALLENWGSKVLAFVLATLLWMYVVGEKRSEVSLSVPLELTGVPASMVIVNRVPETVQVRLSGPRTLLVALTPQQLSVALDLSAIQPGTTTFGNLPARMKLPKRIDVTYVSPSVITLDADTKARKRLPVKLRVKGEPAPGYRVVEVGVDPAEVEIEGSARVLKSLEEVSTQVLDIHGAEETQTRPVDLSLPDPTLRRVSKVPVVAQVTVEEQRGEREFARVPVVLPGRRWVAAPASVDVLVAGGTVTLGRLGPADVSATVESEGKPLAKGTHRVTVQTPAGVEVLSISPRAVEVRLRNTDSASSKGSDADGTGE
ncbi:MAG: hypothetical protein HZB55_13000 [Deltaproteobacteria bacterium]|nr:hypothetical protein [Deltaproteobacteria bacterium]